MKQLNSLDLRANILSSIESLDFPSLKELYLQDNKLTVCPDISGTSVKIFGFDWFTYLAMPYTLPKIVEDHSVIQKIKQNPVTFIGFAELFCKPYSVDQGQRHQEEGKTALHMAIGNNDTTMTQLLLKNGADPNLMDCYQ